MNKKGNTFTPDSDPLDNIGFSLNGSNLELGGAMSMLKGVISSWYGMCIVVASAGFVLSLIVATIGFMLTGKSPRARQEYIETVGFKVIVSLGVFAFILIVGVIGGVVEYFA